MQIILQLCDDFLRPEVHDAGLGVAKDLRQDLVGVLAQGGRRTTNPVLRVSEGNCGTNLDARKVLKI